MAMASPTLPSDIIIDILTRLPSKTLIRFKSVSKQWYSLINSPYFINLHLSQTLISDNYPNLIISQSTFFSSPISDDHTNPNFHFSKLDHPYKHCFCRILGSINGVLCISLHNHPSVALFNPSTKAHRLIQPFTPSPNTNPESVIIPVENVVVFGFGFDSVRRDYKLVRMIETREDNVSVYRESSVYSLKNDSWKCVNDQTLFGHFFLQKRINDRVVFVNEGLHFIVVGNDRKPKVKCFNLRTETFSIFDLPMLDDGAFSRMDCARALGGCFSVTVNYLNYIRRPVLERVDLWVMKEYGNKESWFRLFSISDPAILRRFPYVRPVIYSKDKEWVLLELDGLSFGWYSWGNNTLERITNHGWPGDGIEPPNAWTFLDSLVSLGKDKGES